MAEDCVNWKKSKRPNGYGQIWKNGTNNLTHRYFYEEKYGKIPQRLVIDHLCKNRLCINLNHMELVTRKENVRRGLAAKITDKIAIKIRKLYKEKRYIQKELANMYRIGQDQISRIINNRRWI